jgi:hypothetical protein
MKVTTLTRKTLKYRRQKRDLLKNGYEEVGERGGKLWELYRGWRHNHVIVSVKISENGKSLFIKTEVVE